MKFGRIIMLVGLMLVLFIATAITGQAQCRRNCPPPPVLTVLGEWTPSEQLTSQPADTRQVSLKMSATSDRPFWAMDISCLVTSTEVSGEDPVVFLGDVFDGTAINQTMALSASWKDGDGTTFQDFTVNEYYDPNPPNPLEPNEKRINATVTRVGATNSPIGLNGVTYTEDLFILTLDVAESLVGTYEVTLTCDKLVFLDRNGNSLGQINYTGKTLTLSDGYTIAGKATRQGNTNTEEIEVTCEHIDSGRTYDSAPVTGFTYDSRGRVTGEFIDGFAFDKAQNGTDPLRDYGLYRCDYTSEIGGTEDSVYLKANTYLSLETTNYKIQPVTLLGGDINGDDEITVADFAMITGNWQQPQTAYTQGDVNGDGFVNEADLAITAGNVGLVEGTHGVTLDHVIYSVARDYSSIFPNNRLAMGSSFAGAVTDFNAGLEVTVGSGRRVTTEILPVRAFWPQVSPDGTKVAYSMEGEQTVTEGRGRSAVTRTVQLNGITVGDAEPSSGGTLLASGQNYAPSWSPSGNQIAYICSWDGGIYGINGILGYGYNNGNLCVMNADGTNQQTIIPFGSSSTYAKIFPPTWYDETTIIYAGNADNTLCSSQLCYYDMLTNTHGKLTINGINGTTNKADMPVIVSFDGVSYLFYRAYTNSDSDLRMGRIAYESGGNLWTGSNVSTDIVDSTDFHQSVDDVDGVHYYDVSPLFDVMFYEFGDYHFTNVAFNLDDFINLGTFEWDSAGNHVIHSVDNFIGYPMTIIDEPTNVWNGYTEGSIAPTDFHAYRPTFDWIP